MAATCHTWAPHNGLGYPSVLPQLRARHGAAPLALPEGESQPGGALGMNAWNSRAAGDVFPEKKMGFVTAFWFLGKRRSQMFSVWQLKLNSFTGEEWCGRAWGGWDRGSCSAQAACIYVLMFLPS